MAERLVVVSDMWGSKKGLWITSYLGYLQQYFDIVFYDSRELAQMEKKNNTAEGIYNAFINGGLDTAVSHLLAKESEASHYLTFCAGGTIAWQAGINGLPMKSLYAVSPIEMHHFSEGPDCPITLLYGELEDKIPSPEWSIQTKAVVERIPKFGHEMYSDEKIIRKVCLDLLDLVIKKQYQI